MYENNPIPDTWVSGFFSGADGGALVKRDCERSRDARGVTVALLRSKLHRQKSFGWYYPNKKDKKSRKEWGQISEPWQYSMPLLTWMIRHHGLMFLRYLLLETDGVNETHKYRECIYINDDPSFLSTYNSVKILLVYYMHSMIIYIYIYVL